MKLKLNAVCINPHTIHSPVYTGPQTGSGLESGLRPRNGGGPGDPDRDLDRLRLHGAESGIGSRKVISCKRGLCHRPPGSALHIRVYAVKGGSSGGPGPIRQRTCVTPYTGHNGG